jgi:hypothetical protein
MSSSNNFVIKDVHGDGSCFYRALYTSAKYTDLVQKLISLLAGRERKKVVSEDKFVALARRYISRRVLKENDGGVVKEVYNHLYSLEKENYAAVMVAFPSWFRKRFRKLPKDEDTFRTAFAQAILETENWVSEIEIRILLWVLSTTSIQLEIVNTKPKGTQRKWNANTMYVWNRNEAHYLAILPKRHSSSSKQSNNLLLQAKVKPVAKSSVSVIMKTMAKARKNCEDGSLHNPATKRCVKATSCKGYELQADMFKKLLGISDHIA